MVEIALGSLIQVLVYSFSAISGMAIVIGLFICKKFYEAEFFDVKDPLFHKHEQSFYYYVGFYGSMFLTPAVFSVLFSRIYIETYELEAGPYILATVLIYWVLMALWLVAQYVWTKKETSVSIIFAVLAGISNIACIVLCIVTISGATIEKLLTGSLLIPVVFAIIASGTSNLYRKEILHVPKERSPAGIRLDGGYDIYQRN